MNTRNLFFLVVSFALAACTRSISPPTVAEVASATASPTEAPPTETPTEQFVSAFDSTKPATESPTPEPPTETIAATESPPSETPTPSATATQPPFNPSDEYGSATFLDSFADSRYWSDVNGNLPDTDFIRLALGNGQLHVTGKPAQFDTWWFTSITAGDQFIEMQVETDNCSGKQAYGLILRGPASNSSVRGYIVTFSCDGAYHLVRLDSLNPYTSVELIPWTEAEAINAGANQSNTLGIRLLGDSIAIYANDSLLEEFEDDRYSSGRFGLFVNAGFPGDFTFRLEELAFWNLD